MLMGVSAFAQKPKYIYLNAYSKGKVIKTLRVIKLVPKMTLPKPQIKYVTKVVKKKIEIPVEKVITKEIVKYDTVKVPVEKIVEKEVIKKVPYETLVEKVVEKRIETPPTRNVYLGPNLLITNRNSIHGLGLSALIKNKHGELFQISGGMIMRQGMETPAPFINLGAFIKIK
jgi:hypothetical protein